MESAKMLYGIEHEVAFLNQKGEFVDFAHPDSQQFFAIIEALPKYEADYPKLRIGDPNIRVKRWYIEGYERFDNDGVMTAYIPKGIEIRTTPQPTAQAAIAELRQSFALLKETAAAYQLEPVWASFNPYRIDFPINPPFSAYEQARFGERFETQTEHLAMLTYGPDLNLSFDGLSDEALLDIARKLTFYSPYLIPFSFSSPLYAGGRWHGPSVRTYYRTGKRMAAMVYIRDQRYLNLSTPPLTHRSRSPEEAGRIEFKAFDAVRDFSLYGSLFALLQGVILDTTLAGRANVPDQDLHQHAASYGLRDEHIRTGSQTVLMASKMALASHPDQEQLTSLELMLQARTMPADEMLALLDDDAVTAENLRKLRY